MCRADQAVVLLISNMRFMHTYFAFSGTVFRLFNVMVKGTPWNHCNSECPYEEQGQYPGNM